MIAPKIPLLRDGQILSANLVNSMIARIEYAADLLRQFKCISGEAEIYIEPHFDGTRVSYNQPVAGGATPTLPLRGQNQQNLYDLVGENGSGKTFNSAEQASLFGDINNFYDIDLADITGLFGLNAYVLVTGSFLTQSRAFGYIEGLSFAWWVFWPGFNGTGTSELPPPPDPSYNVTSVMGIWVGVPFISLTFEIAYK